MSKRKVIKSIDEEIIKKPVKIGTSLGFIIGKGILDPNKRYKVTLLEINDTSMNQKRLEDFVMQNTK